MDARLNSEQQKQRHSDLEEARSFIEKGEKFTESVLPTRVVLGELVQYQTLGRVVRNAISDLGNQIARDPSMVELIEPKLLRQQAEVPALKIFIERTPIANYLRKIIPDESMRSEVLNQIVMKVARYAQAVRRSEQINRAALNAKGQVVGRAGQVTYRFDTFLDNSASEILRTIKKTSEPEVSGNSASPKEAVNESSSNLDWRSLPSLIRQSQERIEAQLNPDTQFFALLNWVSETVRKVRQEGLKVFETPEAQALLTSLERRAEQRNGLGGAILYGPPGTGKTELLVERNKRRGFDSRVISIHHFTDFVQLVGEKPVPLGIDRDASQLQRLQMTRESIAAMSAADRLAYVRNQLSKGEAAWGAFLSAVGVSSETSPREIDEPTANAIIDALLQKISTTIINVGLGLEAGMDTDEAWVKGEIIQAFEAGKMPILDEMDKGSSHSLEGISRLLNLSPGSVIQLGSTSYKIPHWGSIDGTANDMNLAPFLHDRFAPNVIYVDYPSPQELLLRSVVWLSDEQGNLDISESVQEQYVGLVMYVFPQIQKLYPSKIEHPLSNRGIKKFCQMLTQGSTISEALNELLLKPGALSDKESGRNEIQRVLARFPTITTSSIGPTDASNRNGKHSLLSSPLYSVASRLYTPYDASRGSSGVVEIAPDDYKALSREDDRENRSNQLVAPCGIKLAIETKDGQSYLTSRVNGRLITRVRATENFVLSATESKILGCSTTADRALIRTNNALTIVDFNSGSAIAHVISETQNSQSTLTSDGKFLVHKSGDTVVVYHADQLIKSTKTDEHGIRIVDEDGDQVRVRRLQTSADGKYLLLETSARETHIFPLSTIPTNARTLALSNPFPTGGTLSIGKGNIAMDDSNPSTGYMLK